MRVEWKIVLPSIIIACLALLNSNCQTLYKIRSPKEIEELSEEIIPLPESLLTIPEFNGRDTIPIFYFDQYGGRQPWIAHMLYNDGKLEFLSKFYGGQGIFVFGYINVSEIQDFILELNQMGFFSVNHESIKKKKYIEYRGCFLGLFFGGHPAEPARFDMTTHTIEVELTGIKHTISYYDVGYAAEKYPTLVDLQVLKESIDFIDDFLTEKRHDIY